MRAAYETVKALVLAAVAFAALVLLVGVLIDASLDAGATIATNAERSDIPTKSFSANVTPKTTAPAPSTTTTAAPVPIEQRWPWPQLADCESDSRWTIRDSIHEGGLQFAAGTWDAYKPAGYPDNAGDATPHQQVLVAIRVRDGATDEDPALTAQGYGAWPNCSIEVGAR